MTLNDFRDFCAENAIRVEQQRFVASGGAISRGLADTLPNPFAQLGIYVVSKAVAEKGTGTFCLKGPKGASPKTYLSPFPRPA
jgi:hypothetical protein